MYFLGVSFYRVRFRCHGGPSSIKSLYKFSVASGIQLSLVWEVKRPCYVLLCCSRAVTSLLFPFFHMLMLRVCASVYLCYLSSYFHFVTFALFMSTCACEPLYLEARYTVVLCLLGDPVDSWKLAVISRVRTFTWPFLLQFLYQPS
jgi:hypothetical protein